MAERFSLKQFILGISFGMVFILILGFMYLRADVFFPQNSSAWKDYLQTSILFFTTVFALSSSITNQISRELFRISFVVEIWKYFLSFIISFAAFYGLGLLVAPNSILSVHQALSSTPFGIILLYSIVVSFPEELIFRTIVPKGIERARSQAPQWAITSFSVLIFALYHWTIGRSIYTLIIYIPLGFLLTFIKNRFSPATNMANAGMHASWDLFLYGFLP